MIDHPPPVDDGAVLVHLEEMFDVGRLLKQGGTEEEEEDPQSGDPGDDHDRCEVDDKVGERQAGRRSDQHVRRVSDQAIGIPSMSASDIVTGIIRIIVVTLSRIIDTRLVASPR